MYHRIGVGVPNVIFRLSFWEALTFSVAGVFFCAGIFWFIIDAFDGYPWIGFSFFLSGLGAATSIVLVYILEVDFRRSIVIYLFSVVVCFVSIMAISLEHPGLRVSEFEGRIRASDAINHISIGLSIGGETPSREARTYAEEILVQCGTSIHQDLSDLASQYFSAIYLGPMTTVISRVFFGFSMPEPQCLNAIKVLKKMQPGIFELSKYDGSALGGLYSPLFER
ncbi:hypothetical protein [Thalassospira sp. UBA1131]|uniref:hypothetical protein n=1 Tax=Thalassospira sp. UBA1131 TaxID=1947672 RepID=UPI0025F63CC0|nr:hypothetical protein [Thalassospira sp. UBA1131]